MQSNGRGNGGGAGRDGVEVVQTMEYVSLLGGYGGGVNFYG